MQGKESEKESNSGEIRNPKEALRNFRKACENEEFCNHKRALRNFIKLEGILQRLAKLKNFAKPCETEEFCNPFSGLQNLLVIFRYFCTDSVRFLSQNILCNYLFSPCNQLKIF